MIGATKELDGVEVCLLAGGLSSRMGRDKARLRLGRHTLLGKVHAAARELGLPVRVVRRDLVARCGPLGGIYTGLKRSKRLAVLFLSCDLPFVSAELLRWVLKRFERTKREVFLTEGELAGFPLLIRRENLVVVARQIEGRAFSIQKLALALGAKPVRCPRKFAGQLFNVNTPEDWQKARVNFRVEKRESSKIISKSNAQR